MKVSSVLVGIFLPLSAAFSPCQVVGPEGGRRTAATSTSRPPLTLFSGGFAGKNAKEKAAVAKQVKLKPKQQWDRYLDMKTETKIPVGIRMKEDDAKDWLQVGHVRSKEGAYTAVSVVMQRALIAEHAKRLFPLQVSPKKTLEWAYLVNDEWTVVDKSILDQQTLPDGLEKQIGFEGTPDPATGYYCIYDGGKLKLGDESSFK